MNVFAKFDGIPSMILQDIEAIKHYEHTGNKVRGLFHQSGNYTGADSVV